MIFYRRHTPSAVVTVRCHNPLSEFCLISAVFFGPMSPEKKAYKLMIPILLPRTRASDRRKTIGWTDADIDLRDIGFHPRFVPASQMGCKLRMMVWKHLYGSVPYVITSRSGATVV